MTRSAGRRSIGCVLLAILAILAPASAQQARRSPEVQREQLHAALRQSRDPHDIYISLAGLADETTVPLLIERFRRDFPAAPPPEPAPAPVWIDPSPFPIGRVGPLTTGSSIAGFDCAQAHLVDALAYATNTNRGMYYPAWQAWWDENRQKSRREWIAAGFREAGLVPSDPVDEQFGLGLIDLLPDSRAYLAVNAQHLLQTVPAVDRVAWIQQAARSEQRQRRLGAVFALQHLERAGHEDLLRTLTADPDAEVRLAALSVLNARLRQRPDRQAKAFRVRGPDKARGFEHVAVTDDLLVAGGSGGIEVFDARDGRRRWRNRSITANDLLILDGRVMASYDEGALAGFDARGQLAWRWPSRREGDDIRRLFAIDRQLGVLRTDSLEWHDPDTGRILHSIAAERIMDADASGRTVYVLLRDQLQKVVDGRVLARQEVRGGLGVSARGSTVFVIQHGGERPASAAVACYDADTLALRWTQAAPPTNTWGHDVAPVQSASSLYLSSSTQLTALRVADGAPLWADRVGQEGQGALVVTTWGLLSSAPDYRLELRELGGGEVVAIWPGKRRAVAVAPSGRVAALAASDGSLWIVRPPDVDPAAAVVRPDVASPTRRP